MPRKSVGSKGAPKAKGAKHRRRMRQLQPLRNRLLLVPMSGQEAITMTAYLQGARLAPEGERVVGMLRDRFAVIVAASADPVRSAA